MDERLDRQIVNLNKKYQDLKDSKEYAAMERLSRYTGYLKTGSVKRMIRELRFSRHAGRHQSLKGNINYRKNHSQADIKGRRIVVYTCIAGAYDRLIEPVVKENRVDFVVFTDQQVPSGSAWVKQDISQLKSYQTFSPVKLNREIKIRPYLFLDYDYSIYVDGNIQVVGAMTPVVRAMGDAALGLHFHSARDCIYDEMYGIRHLGKADMTLVNRQIKAYRKERFPSHSGLYENSIILRDHRNQSVRDLMEAWWQEYVKYPTRDQLSLPYVIWKTNFDRSGIYVLGNRLDHNPRFNRENHLK